MPKLHDFKPGDKVTLGNGRKIWTVVDFVDGDGGVTIPSKEVELLGSDKDDVTYAWISELKPAITVCRDAELEAKRIASREGKKRSDPPPASRLITSLKGGTPTPAVVPQLAPGGPPHVEVGALAGTGKTTTLVEGMKSQRELPSKITPSPQQETIWEQLKLGRSDTVMFGAFGHDIAATLKRKLAECGLDKARCEAKTMHGMGYRACIKAGLDVQQEEPSENNDQRLVCELLNTTPMQLRKDKPLLLMASAKLAGLCKLNLKEPTHEELDLLASYYDVDTGTEIDKMVVYDLVPKVLERAKEPRGSISFDDMVWLPNVLNLRMWKNDLFLGDEVQDWNLAQQGIAKRSGYRLVLCGDEHQSIFGFAGADVQAMTRLREELGKEPRGHICLPLTVTRRCGKAIVEEAKQYVPSFEAHPDNPEGEVRSALYPIQPDGFQKTKVVPDKDTYLPLVQDGDMVLCRTNAPLVSQCFKQIGLGRRAHILGRKIGQGLVALVEKLKASSVNDLITKLEGWKDKEVGMENAKKFPSESRLQGLQDKYDCVVTFCRDACTPADVVHRINSIFTDDGRGGIQHSSIHKAKGLEAQRVFFLQPAVVFSRPPKTAWEQQQEDNLQYVAITRAIGSLTYVS
jgi:hypothetical protein